MPELTRYINYYSRIYFCFGLTANIIIVPIIGISKIINVQIAEFISDKFRFLREINADIDATG